jgi:hypothetical protein
MAVSTGIFKTPTGPTYDPSRDIERGFDKTTGIITGFMEKKAQDYDQQQEMFGQVASRIGEIEATLQQNYAGMQQQAIDSTREWLKQNIKKGTRANDPDFQMGLGQRVGAIRAAMGNADKIKQQINLQIEQLKANPYMDFRGKEAAMAELFAMASNPDVLIDKDPISKMNAVKDKYIDPDLVFLEAYKKFPTTGKVQRVSLDKSGNQVVMEFVGNSMIDQDSPFNEQGLPNLKLNSSNREDIERALDIYQRDPDLARVIDAEAARRYPTMNNDAAITQVLKEGFSRVAPATMSTNIRKTAEELEKERIMMEKDQAQMESYTRLTDAQIANYYSLAGSRKDAEEFASAQQADYDRFVKGFEKGDNAVLKPYERFMTAQGMKNIQWEKNVKMPDIKSYEDWKDLGDNERRQALIAVGKTGPIHFYKEGKKGSEVEDLEIKTVYDLFDRERRKSGSVSGVSFEDKEGNKVTRSFDDVGGVNGLYDWLMQYRYSGKNYIPVGEVSAGTQGSFAPTPGFTLNATQFSQQQ